MTITNVERVQKTTAQIEAAGVIDKQWGFSTDDLRIICRNGANYYHMAGLSSTTNDFTGAITVGTTLGVTGVTTLTDDLVVDTDTLFVDASTDRVGIGTASPDVTLQVDSGATGEKLRLKGASTYQLRVGEDNSGRQYLDSLNGVAELDFRTNSSSRMLIDSSGNVGIGTTSPGAKLSVEDSVNVAGNIKTTATNGNASLEIENDVQKYALRTVGSTSDSFIIRDSTSAADRLVIDTSGNVGIGTISPSTKLHVTGDVTLDEDLIMDDLKEIRMGDDGTYYSRMYYSGSSGSGTLYIDARSSSGFKLQTGGADRFSIGQKNVSNGGLTVNESGLTTIAGDFRAESANNTHELYVDATNSTVGINTSSPSSNANLTLGDGTLCMAETTTPTADTNFGKIYCKNDNKLYFQDGAGTEHEIQFV
jgi:hypothetical protein